MLMKFFKYFIKYIYRKCVQIYYSTLVAKLDFYKVTIMVNRVFPEMLVDKRPFPTDASVNVLQ